MLRNDVLSVVKNISSDMLKEMCNIEQKEIRIYMHSVFYLSILKMSLTINLVFNITGLVRHIFTHNVRRMSLDSDLT